MTTITDTIAAELLREHNAGYAGGTERESYAEPPIWMVRRAERIAAAIEPEIRKREWAAVSRARRADQHEKEQA